jgi:hypothetical protein
LIGMLNFEQTAHVDIKRLLSKRISLTED